MKTNKNEGGFLVPNQGLEEWWKNILDPTMELVQVQSEWECEGLTVWQFQKKATRRSAGPFDLDKQGKIIRG
tara:strand:+ start:17492 stop:17707 length:216 start_codon:yes stop_codon:yes gene_type:complete